MESGGGKGLLGVERVEFRKGGNNEVFKVLSDRWRRDQNQQWKRAKKTMKKSFPFSSKQPTTSLDNFDFSNKKCGFFLF